METVAPVLLLGLAGFCFGGAYAMYTQRKPLWSSILLAVFGLLSLAAGVLYL